MKKPILVALCALYLAGCVAVPEPVLNHTPIEVEHAELDNYWQLKEKRFTTQAKLRKVPGQGAVVEVRYLIDSNGKTHQPEVVNAEPNSQWNQSALNAVKQMEYVNAPDNGDQIPVYVITQFTFEVGG